MNASRRFALFALVVFAATILYAQDKPKKASPNSEPCAGPLWTKTKLPSSRLSFT